SSACLIDILMTLAAIIQMDSTLRSLRDFITADVRKHEERKRLSLKHLIEQAITHMIEFAKSSRVDIVRKERDFDAEVEGIERDLVRALQNLLHNAIKYSWRRDRARAPWITIRAYARDQFACVEFENWGVAISQEEIDNALIFQLGYRGKWSKDRGRLGTGIGMTDAKRVAQDHRGDVLVTSRPAVSGAHRADDLDYYSQPFITTVTFCLPQVGKQ
ncbi:partial Sensor histidine kinase CusS, partial [Gammaproteobacteria bacterium]